IIMSDHGGHDRTHGTLLPEDMTIPFFFYGKEFAAGALNVPVSLLEIAPTIVKILGIDADEDWEGHSVF
ncbi:MAG: nucleotide pyrophosphatase, partial [Clostridia bacterium]|nr:nucleotide pyrophosphatase [Clostridia bacterium]